MATAVRYRETVLKLDNVSLQRDGVPVLNGINAEIRDIVGQGQIVCLLGASGVGKTTLLRLIAGLEPPQQGSISVFSEKEGTLRPVESGMVGLVGQHYPLFRHRTVLGNLLLAASLKNGDAAENQERCLYYLQRFGLAGQRDSYPVQLSGGQKQRVAILQQLLCSEHFILMDEPFSGLDILAQEEVCRLIREVASLDELNTVVVVTHGIEEGLMVADTLWMLGRDRDQNGQVAQGASIKASFDLVGEGLTWRDGGADAAKFQDLVRTVKEQYRGM